MRRLSFLLLFTTCSMEQTDPNYLPKYASSAPTTLQAVSLPNTPAAALVSPVSSVQISAMQPAQCAETGYVPVALVDIDGDGKPERPAATRNGTDFEIRLYQVPDLKKTFETKLRADYLEVSTTPNPKTHRGDLWVHAGVAKDEANWSFTLWHLEAGKLVSVWTGTGSDRPNLRLDLDADGDIDPILRGDKGSIALINGATVDLLGDAWDFLGMPTQYGLEEPIDLDADGDIDLLVHGENWLGVFDLGSKSLVWKKKVEGPFVGLVRWDEKPAILVVGGQNNDTRSAYLLSTKAKHEALIDLGPDVFYMGLSYDLLPSYVDPGGLVVRQFGGGTVFVKPKQAPQSTAFELAVPADLSRGKQPLPQFITGQTSLLGFRHLSFGSPAMGGTGESTYELALLTSPTTKKPEVIYTASIPGDGSANVSYFDLEGDGISEILLTESSGYMTCDMQGGGSSMRYSLLRGDGKFLYQDEKRHSSFDTGYRSNDQTAKAAVLDLGTKERALRFRTWNQEWWVLPQSFVLPKDKMPTCLE
jgi:hypothetical protein